MQISDSDALGYLISQLTHIEATVWQKKYNRIRYPDLMPVSFEAGEWATSVQVHFQDGFVAGKFIGAGSRDMPFARVNTGRDIIPVGYGGIGYEYSLEDLRQAAFLNRPLDASQASLARRGFEEHAQLIAFFGDADRGMTGLLNNGDVPTGAAATTLAAALAGANPGDDAAALVNEAINTVSEQSNGIEMADTVLMPLAHRNLLATTRLGAITETTILAFIEEKNSYTAETGNKLNVKALPELTNSLMAYANNNETLVYHIPMPLRFVAPQPIGLQVQIPGEYKLAGVEFRYPGAAVYRTGF